MAMHAAGLTKLMEECGELIQVCAKKSAYFDVDIHPDGNSLTAKMEEELADVFAAGAFVMGKFKLDEKKIEQRIIMKLARFRTWDREP